MENVHTSHLRCNLLCVSLLSQQKHAISPIQEKGILTLWHIMSIFKRQYFCQVKSPHWQEFPMLKSPPHPNVAKAVFQARGVAPRLKHRLQEKVLITIA